MEDGWFHTGDLAKQLPSGAYKITGRIKSMIGSPGGKKVFPEELEMFLEKSPYISECMVCGKETDSAVRITALVFPDADAVAEKLAVGETVADALAPVHERFDKLMADKGYLESVMKEGSARAAYLARKTLSKVYRKVGFTQPK